MRVASVVLHRVEIPLKRAFAHAKSTRTTATSVLVQLVDDAGTSGWGEIKPRAYVTGETIDGVLAHTGPRLAATLVGRTLADRQAVAAWIEAALAQADAPLATLTGLELALVDLAGKRLGFSAASLCGTRRGAELPAGIIVGFETPTDKLARHCAVLRLSGKRHVKVKVGRDDDLQRLAAVTRVFGPGVPLRIDANMAWTPDEAIARLAAMRDVCPLHSVEQPVARDDVDGLARVRAGSGVPVMADESVCSLADARRLADAGAVDLFNVRIGKHGGLLGSLRILELAQRCGVRVHLGTLVGETGILSRAAEVLGRCAGPPGAFACLDGKGQNAFLLDEDVVSHATEGTEAPPLDSDGLGIEVDEARVARLRVGDRKDIRP